MSRAYRIKVHETTRKVLRASDHVTTELEILEILPCEQMAILLAAELQKRGFKLQGDKLVRSAADGIVVEVDPAALTVTAKIEEKHAVTLEGERQGWSAVEQDSLRENDRRNLRQELRKDLDRQADEQTSQLQKKVTDRLEGHLADLRKELDQAVNRVTADALKQKAAQIGQIKEVSEDANTGSMTIVVEL